MGTSDDLGGLDRVAANERHFLARSVGARGAPIVLSCECTHRICDERIDLTPEQYEPVRSSGARYAIYPHGAHVDPSVDTIVERRLSHWVVERQSTVEMLDFFVPSSDTRSPEPTPHLTDQRVGPASENGPGASP